MSSGTKILLVALALMPLVIMIIMNFSNRKNMKKNMEVRKQELGQLKRGDKVLTISGIYGFVEKINNDVVMLEISKGVIIEVNKGSIVCSV